MEEEICEPLNLCKRKPVAIVAPSPVKEGERTRCSKRKREEEEHDSIPHPNPLLTLNGLANHRVFNIIQNLRNSEHDPNPPNNLANDHLLNMIQNLRNSQHDPSQPNDFAYNRILKLIQNLRNPQHELSSPNDLANDHVLNLIQNLRNTEHDILATMYMGRYAHMFAGQIPFPLQYVNPWTSPPPAHKELSISVPRLDQVLLQQSALTVPTLETISPESSRMDSDSTTSPRWPSSMDRKSSSSANDGSNAQDPPQASNNQEKKKPHIKKPLNAFMLYMKEMRAKVVAECTLKESAAINQILGRRWHSLSREEQATYYEKARVERQLHMELYPGWSARDNYGYGAKKKKRKKERVTITDSGGNSMKKCRARYGLDQQSQWCKPCRRKKKCIRYKECGDDGTFSEDNLGSVDSVGDSRASPDCDGESYLPSCSSSPDALSGLSSLTSPGLLASPGGSLHSPSVSLASPSLQSPLTPGDYDIKPPRMVGANPHDANNPLSVNQLTGKCVKPLSPPHHQSQAKEARTVISVP